jgi:hypothetical protein
VAQPPRQADEALRRSVCGIDIALREPHADEEREVGGRERTLVSQPLQRPLELRARQRDLPARNKERDHDRAHLRVLLPAGDQLLGFLDASLPNAEPGEASKWVGGQRFPEPAVGPQRGV